jgi:phage shock protein C
MRVWRHDYFWPAVLIVLGIYFLLRNVGILNWLNSDIVWPVLLIILGVWLIVRRARP